jgi:hypothetical protein
MAGCLLPDEVCPLNLYDECIGFCSALKQMKDRKAPVNAFSSPGTQGAKG